MPGGGAATDAYHNYPFVSAFGGSIFAYDPETGVHDPSEVRLDTPEAIQGAQYLADQVSAGVVASTDYDTAKNLFLEGSSAFWITGPWELGSAARADDGQLGRGGDPPDRRPADPDRSWVHRGSSSRPSPSRSSWRRPSCSTSSPPTKSCRRCTTPTPAGRPGRRCRTGCPSDPRSRSLPLRPTRASRCPTSLRWPRCGVPWVTTCFSIRNGEVTADEAMTTAAEAVRSAIAGG